MSETLGLKNVNMMSKDMYSGLSDVATDELYAISGSGFGFPSDRYDDLELGASGTEYTAPANGWVYCVPKFTTNGWLQINNRTSGGMRMANLAQISIWEYAICYVPCKKGDVFGINYSGTITSSTLRFIYAEGE